MSEIENQSGSRVGVVDYGGGNIRNVLNVLAFLGHEGELISGPDDLEGIDRLIFPGVGSFGDCMEQLDHKKLRDPLVTWLKANRPFFGICLGYQALFESSEESPDVKGLGFLPGQVVQFPMDRGLKVPHMGWNEVTPEDPDYFLWKQTDSPLHLYFVHSYYPNPEDESLISSRTSYGDPFASSVTTGNIFACQFHPERSQDAGLRLVKNFLEAE